METIKSQSVQASALKQAVTKVLVMNPKLLLIVKSRALRTVSHDAGLLAPQIQLFATCSSI